MANNRIFFPCKEQLNDPAELVHPIEFEDSTWRDTLLEASQAISRDTRRTYDRIYAKFSRLNAVLGDEQAHHSEDPNFHRYREAFDKHMVVLEMVYEQVEVHEALKYYVLCHAEDTIFKYDSQTNIFNRLNAKLGKLGVLSLARRCDCPVMWCHYAANHTGVVLVFDTNEDQTFNTSRDIAYIAERPKLQVNNFIEVLYTKSEAWKYEAESRILQKEGNQCYEFDQGALAGVILGMHMDQKVKERIAKIVKNRKQPVQLHQAQASPDSYQIVRTKINSN